MKPIAFTTVPRSFKIQGEQGGYVMALTPCYTAAIYLGRPGFRDVVTRAAEASGIRARPAEEISQGGNTLWVIPSSPLPELVRRLPEEVRSRRADGDVVIGVCDISKASGIESALAGLVTDDLRVIWYRDDGTSLGALYSALIDAFKRYADAPEPTTRAPAGSPFVAPSDASGWRPSSWTG